MIGWIGLVAILGVVLAVAGVPALGAVTAGTALVLCSGFFVAFLVAFVLYASAGGPQ